MTALGETLKTYFTACEAEGKSPKAIRGYRKSSRRLHAETPPRCAGDCPERRAQDAGNAEFTRRTYP